MIRNKTFSRELHIDAHEISSGQVDALLKLGFYQDHFTGAGGGLECPAQHYTWETEGDRNTTGEMRRRTSDSLMAVLADPLCFRGYIESEIIPPGFQISFPARPFQPLKQRQIPRLPLIKTTKNKVADLHVKVPFDLLTQPLIAEFDGIGCYFVETPKRNRIYTVQFLDHRQGNIVFEKFQEFFEVSGGVTELTYEVCDEFVRVPLDLEAPAVLSPDFSLG